MNADRTHPPIQFRLNRRRSSSLQRACVSMMLRSVAGGKVSDIFQQFLNHHLCHFLNVPQGFVPGVPPGRSAHPLKRRDVRAPSVSIPFNGDGKNVGFHTALTSLPQTAKQKARFAPWCAGVLPARSLQLFPSRSSVFLRELCVSALNSTLTSPRPARGAACPATRQRRGA